MRPNIQRSKERVIRMGFDFAAGDYMTYVPQPNPVAITGASNEEPIVITAPDNNLAEYALVTIADVGGNLAANGDHRIGNLAGDTFELFDLAGEPIAGDGEYTQGGTVSRAPTSLLSVKYRNFKGSAEGMEVFAAGIENQEEFTVMLLRSYLIAQGITEISPEGHFLYLGARWDLKDGKPLVVDLGAVGGADDPQVMMTLRRAVELEHSSAGSVGFNLT